MRIGLLSQWYPPEPTLMPSVLAHELVARGHVAKVLTGFPNYPTGHVYDGYRVRLRTDERNGGVEVRRVALYASHSDSRVGRLANYVTFAASASLFGISWFSDVEAVWVANSPPTVGLPTWLARVRHRPRIVLHILDAWPESLYASALGRPLMRVPGLSGLTDRWLSMTYQLADSIACTSRRQIELLTARGVPTDKLAYVPIWVDEHIFHPAPKDHDLARQIGVEDKLVVLYAGSIGEPQGLEVLVESFARLKDVPGIHCLIAGTGTAEAKLRARTRDLALDNVTFLGPWPAADMTRLMSIGDIHFVSLKQDPLTEVAMPSKIPATLACGKPIIVSAGGEAATTVAESRAGWACPPGDVDSVHGAITSAIAGGDRGLKEMGARARNAYLGQFAVAAGVQRIEHLLSGIS